MTSYPVTVEPDGDQYLVTFRDIPEAITCGKTIPEALEMAYDALITAMDFYIDDSRSVPLPSEPQIGDRLVELPTSLFIKILLLNEMISQRVRPVDLARRMHLKKQEITRFIKLNHTTKIDSLSEAFKALGKTLEIHVK